MLHNDEPLNSGGARKFTSLDPSIPAMPHDAPRDQASVDVLFEDILDIEGDLRVAMTSVAGFGAPGIDQLERRIGELAGRLPAAAASLLRTQAQALRAAFEAKDADQIRDHQAALVDTLTTLRENID